MKFSLKQPVLSKIIFHRSIKKFLVVMVVRKRFASNIGLYIETVTSKLPLSDDSIYFFSPEKVRQYLEVLNFVERGSFITEHERTGIFSTESGADRSFQPFLSSFQLPRPTAVTSLYITFSTTSAPPGLHRYTSVLSTFPHPRPPATLQVKTSPFVGSRIEEMPLPRDKPTHDRHHRGALACKVTPGLTGLTPAYIPPTSARGVFCDFNHPVSDIAHRPRLRSATTSIMTSAPSGVSLVAKPSPDINNRFPFSPSTRSSRSAQHAVFVNIFNKEDE